MSDTMLFGVLRMPYELAMSTELSRRQFHDRAQQACDALEAMQTELELRRKSGSATDRLHNLCEGIAESADGSEWSREEWERIDAENSDLRARVKELEAMQADAARYRWLRGGADIPLESNRWARWEVRYWCGRWWSTMFADQLDTAIDAARGKE